MHARLLAFLAALVLTIAGGSAHASSDLASLTQSARLGLLGSLELAPSEFALASRYAVKESIPTASNRTSRLTLGEQFDAGLGFYNLRARNYDPSSGRFTQMDSFDGSRRDPVSLHKYLYGNADPVQYSDPSGNVSLGNFVTAVSVGAILGGVATPVYNQAIGKATTIGDVAQGAMIGASLTGFAIAGGPWVAGGLTALGIGSSGALVYDVYANPGSTWNQKVAASSLLLAAVAGPAYASRYAGQVWGGPRTINDYRVLHDIGANKLAAFYRSQGFKVAQEVYVRNPFYKVGRRYDLVVQDKNGDFIGFEYKGTDCACANPPMRQVRADGYVNQQGGTMFGSSAETAGFQGGNVGKVVLLGPSSPRPGL